MTNIEGSSGCTVAFLSISIRSNAAAPTAVETWGAIAASVWNTCTVSFSTRDASTARMLAGNGVPSVIGISPPSSPGSRTPMTCSSPFTSFVSSVFPSTTTARNRPSPSCATYSPGMRRTSSTTPTRYSSSFGASAEKSGIAASSSTVITQPPQLSARCPRSPPTRATIAARDYPSRVLHRYHGNDQGLAADRLVHRAPSGGARASAVAAEAAFAGLEHGLRSVGHAELREDRGHVVAHGLEAEAELVGDRLIVAAVREELQDFVFAGGELWERGRAVGCEITDEP